MPYLKAEKVIELCDRILNHIDLTPYGEIHKKCKSIGFNSNDYENIVYSRKTAKIYKFILNREDVPIKNYSFNSLIKFEELLTDEDLFELRTKNTALLPSESMDLEERVSNSNSEGPYRGEVPMGNMAKCCSSLNGGLEL